MTFSLGWQKRDESGKRVRIEFSLIRENISWVLHRARNEPREPFVPSEQDWADLFEVLERHLKRGKVQKEDVDFLRRKRPPHRPRATRPDLPPESSGSAVG